MAALAAGSNITLTLGADDSVSVEVPSGASCIVEQPVGTRIAVIGSGSRQFGPYPAGSQVKLSAEGSAIRYDAVDGAASPYLSPAEEAAAIDLVSGGGILAAVIANATALRLDGAQIYLDGQPVYVAAAA